MLYSKPPISLQDQIDLLKSRGIIFDDEQKAFHQLSTVSYFRLSAYMLPFKKKEGNKFIDEFKSETHWHDIYDLYAFDRKLRLLIFDAIEKIEVAVRCQIVYQLSMKYGSHWQDNSGLFKPAISKINSNGKNYTIDVYSEIQAHIGEQLRNNKSEKFIQHYNEKYGNPANPPSWMCVEIMYFSHLSRICSFLNNRSDITGIATYFNLPPGTFNSWLHTINYVRNLCAHHARLWNRDFNIVPEKLKFSKTKIWISNPDTVQRSKIYYFLCILNYLLQTINPNSSFKNRLKALLTEYCPNLKSMGFPDGWQSEKIWQ